MKISHILLSGMVLGSVTLGGCVANKPKTLDANEAPSITFNVPAGGYVQKYPLSIGVLKLGDSRPFKFYGASDAYFKESPIEASSYMTYRMLANSGLFADVKRLDVETPDVLTVAELTRIKEQAGVDLLFVGNVTDFTLLREKIGESDSSSFKVMVDVGLNGQIIYPNQGVVVWMGSARHDSREAASSGTLSAQQIGNIASDNLRLVLNDLLVHINTTGRNLGGRR